MKFFKKTTFY